MNIEVPYTSANPFMEIQPNTLILGSNMSSGVTVPSFGKKFAKLRQCEQFEVQENSSENKASAWTNFKNSFAWLTGMKQLIFYFNNFFCSGHFLVIFSDLMDQKNGRSQKIHKSKISVFSCLSTTRRNFWNSFILRPYFQSCFPELQIAHTIPVLQFFCRNLAQWLLRTYYFLNWVFLAEFP